MNSTLPTIDELKDRPDEVRILTAESTGCVRYKRPWDKKVFLCRHKPAPTWETTSDPVDVVNSDVEKFHLSHDACRTFEDAMSEEEFERYVEIRLAISLGLERPIKKPIGIFMSNLVAILRDTPLQKCLALLLMRNAAK